MEPNNPNDPQRPLGESNPYPPTPPIFNDPPPAQYADPVNNMPPPPPGPPPVSPGGSYTNASATNASGLTKDERNWAMFAHLSALIVGVIGAATTLPAWSFIGPLVIWLIKRDESPYISDHAKEALNFSISIAILMLIMWFLALILIWTVIVPILMGIGMVVLGIAAAILFIVAAVKASEGKFYRYPFTMRFIK